MAAREFGNVSLGDALALTLLALTAITLVASRHEA
jgi:hypothetical protein